MTSGSHRLLIVDDDPVILEVLQDLLGLAGYRITAVDSGREALELLGRESFDLVLTDLTMADVDGWIIARSVKMRHPGTPVILLTGTRYGKEGVTGSGVDLILTKPCNWQELSRAVEMLLPSKAMGSCERRRYGRFQGRMQSRVVLDAEGNASGEAGGGELIDLSLGGLSFACHPVNLPRCECCRVSILAGNVHKLSSLPCRIVYSIKLSDENAVRRCGVEFGELDEEQRQQLERMLVHQLF